MSDVAENDRAVMGGNNPPEQTPFDLSKQEIDDLYAEAKNWLDGEPITTQEVADKVSKLMSDIRAAVKLADERRKEEAKPFDDGKAEVQARYNPLIAKDKGIADLALSACKEAQKPFLIEQDRIKQEIAAKARAEADRQRREAEEAIRSADRANLVEREEAEAKLRQAKASEAVADKAAKDRAGAKGGARATSLRTSYRAEVTDAREFARYLWQHEAHLFEEFFAATAQAMVSAKRRDIPGITIHEDRSVV